MTRNQTIGCAVAAAVGLVLLIFVGPMLWALFVFFGSQGAHVYLETRSADGRVAHLERPGGGMEPIGYSVKLDGGECTLARLTGYRAQEWVRLSWLGSGVLEIRYGLPPDPEAKGRAPEVVTGEGACQGVEARIIADPSLVPPPGLAGGATHNLQSGNAS